MPKKALEGLTESMFYVLMAFCRGPLCGTDVAAFVEDWTQGAVKLGPATLYTILGKFEKQQYLEETAVEGRKRTYCLTARGREAYEAERARLRRCVADADREEAQRP
jgi:DNA-binding PadR family transcriptional regulator